MNGATTKDSLGGFFGVAALVAGVLEFFWVPFALAPLGLACLMTAILMTPKYRGLFQLTAVVLGIGVVVGGTVAVIAHNPLY